MQTFDPNTVAAVATSAVALASAWAGVLVHRATRGAHRHGEKPDLKKPDLKKLMQDAPCQRIDNNVRVVD